MSASRWSKLKVEDPGNKVYQVVREATPNRTRISVSHNDLPECVAHGESEFVHVRWAEHHSEFLTNPTHIPVFFSRVTRFVWRREAS